MINLQTKNTRGGLHQGRKLNWIAPTSRTWFLGRSLLLCSLLRLDGKHHPLLTLTTLSALRRNRHIFRVLMIHHPWAGWRRCSFHWACDRYFRLRNGHSIRAHVTGNHRRREITAWIPVISLHRAVARSENLWLHEIMWDRRRLELRLLKCHQVVRMQRSSSRWGCPISSCQFRQCLQSIRKARWSCRRVRRCVTQLRRKSKLPLCMRETWILHGNCAFLEENAQRHLKLPPSRLKQLARLFCCTTRSHCKLVDHELLSEIFSGFFDHF